MKRLWASVPVYHHTELSLRGEDAYGSGAFGAPRGDRKHKGLDYALPFRSLACSPVSGRVTKLGYPYKDHLEYRYVEVTDANNCRHRVFYIDPLVTLGRVVGEGEAIGMSQDLTLIYPTGMTPHIHYEVIDPGGNYLNPEEI